VLAVRTPTWVWRWINRRDQIPRWAMWLWPYLHWCPELDGDLVDDGKPCEFCGFPNYPPEPWS